MSIYKNYLKQVIFERLITKRVMEGRYGPRGFCTHRAPGFDSTDQCASTLMFHIVQISQIVSCNFFMSSGCNLIQPYL